MPSVIQGYNLNQAATYSIEYLLANALFNYRPQGRIAVEDESQAFIIYSDALSKSRALQQIALTKTKGRRRLYLINKEAMPAAKFLANLEVKGITEDKFDDIFMAAKPVDTIIEKLKKQNISQVRIFTFGDEDTAAWSSQRLIEALIMILKDKKLQIISNLSEEHERYIADHEQILSQA